MGKPVVDLKDIDHHYASREKWSQLSQVKKFGRFINFLLSAKSTIDACQDPSAAEAHLAANGERLRFWNVVYEATDAE